MTKSHNTNILLLGGTGAIGIYLSNSLLDAGYSVDITTRNAHLSNNPSLKYIRGDAHSYSFLEETLKENRYSAVVDFMVYATKEFSARYKFILNHTSQYLFLSSYRVFADSQVITESSPKLLDVIADEQYLATDEYALAKARQEYFLSNSNYKNWTILRPSITYSRDRFQLGTLEASRWVPRALAGKPIPLPKDMLVRQTTLTWARDSANLISRLIGNNLAFREDFNIATSKHRSWSEIAAIYSDAISKFQIFPTNLDDFIRVAGNPYQIIYDRMYNRELDNSKVLEATGISESELSSPVVGLKHEINSYLSSSDPKTCLADISFDARADRVTRTQIFRFMKPQQLARYLAIKHLPKRIYESKFKLR